MERKLRAASLSLAFLAFAALFERPAAADEACMGEAFFCGNFSCEARHGETPENCPIDCAFSTVRSYNAQTFCTEPARFFTPQSTAEVQSILSDPALKAYRVRVVGGSHSGTALYCSQDIVISTSKLSHVLGMRELNGENVVDVEPGVTLGQLQEWLHDSSYTLGFAVPNFPLITI